MPKRNDLTGQKFKMLTVLGFSHASNRRRQYYFVKCDCGNEKVMTRDSIKKSQSCGCILSEKNKSRAIHGMWKSPEFNTWQVMIARCTNPNNHKYFDYGMRGISVCERWLHSFVNFYADMGDRPSPKHTIDRIDNNGNYEPSNCRWATKKEQSRNKRNNRWIEYEGRKMIVTDWAHEFGLTKGWALSKFLRKHSFEEAVIFYTNKKAVLCK